mmetsp:Transcript_19884/g.25609  ORF Transcript_19884/g.25609 Transcript_19884/m.25609 type:complete len:169 (+) Transcript_19884:188-694(+)|eukprot:CAMPEP_0198139126 /NCGR_PEP_ID=MMETSP1443-20131203/2465_1 /TAXON_ID=186043 /ORGANISM="Entomoneis sp., Strain CCMP2396" /LENGTH=168 /DNA_ID=CAMNT_0043801161 /DNA_START=114 /DNA_END=620 /DNA_ORIENTATION=-
MAPNLKKVTLLCDSLSSEIDAFRAKADAFIPLQPAVKQQISVSQQHAEENASYWDWDSEELCGTALSLERIESNLLKAAAVLSLKAPTTSTADSDDYWAEEQNAQHDEDNEVVEAAQPTSYWDEACHESNNQSTCDKYWEMPSDIVTREDQYWSWSHQQSQSDSYWSQ